MPATPGFGPMQLAWGWACVGVLVGMLLGRVLPDWHGLPPCPVRQGRQSHNQAAPWTEMVREALETSTEPHRRIVLQHLLDEGEPALRLLAAHTRATRVAALERALGRSIDRETAARWGM